MSAIDEFLILFKTQVQDGGLNRLNKRIKSTRNELFSVKNLLRGFIGYDIYSAVRSFIPQMIQTSRDLGAMHARFFAVTNDARLANEEFDWLTAQTQRLGLELMKTADNYSIFFATAKSSLGVGTTREVYSQMLEAIRILHITPEKMSQIFYAFREIASEGTLKLQRLTRQLGTSIPDAMNIAAKSMGYATDKAGIEKFRDAISNAEIDSKTFLINFSRAVSQQYVSTDKLAFAMHQVDAQIQILQNSWQLFMVKMSKAGFSDDLIKVLEGVNKGMAFIEKHAHGIYKAIKLITISLIALGITGTAVNILLLVGKVRMLIASLIELRAVMVAMQFMAGASVGSGAIAGLLGFILNPTGWIALGIAAIVAVLGFGAAILIKKYMPNLYNSISWFWFDLQLSIKDLIRWIYNSQAFQLLQRLMNMGKNKFITDVRNAQTERIKQDPDHVAKGLLFGFDDVVKNWVLNKLHGPARLITGASQAGQFLFNHKTEFKNIVINAESSNPTDIINAFKEEMDKREGQTFPKVFKTFGEAVAASKAHAQNPFALSDAIY